MTTASEPKKPPMWRFPGVWVLLAGFIQSVIGYTWAAYWWAIILRALLADLKWPAAVHGVGLSIGNGVGALGSIAGGVSVDRWGPRWVSMLFLGIMGLGFAGLTTMTEQWHYYIWFGVVIYFVYYGGLYRVSYTAANRWWVEWRSMAIAIVTLGGGMGALIGPWGADLTLAFGWRNMCWFAAFTLIVVCGVVALLYPSRFPETYGLYADNVSPDERRQRVAAAVARRGGVVADERPPLVDMSFTEIVRGASFWIFCIGTFVASTLAPFITFQNVAMGSKGYSLVEAAVFAVYNQIMSYVGRFTVLFFGDWLARRIPIRYLFGGGYVLGGLGALVFALGTQPWHFIVWAVMYGFGTGFVTPYVGVMIGAYWGRTAFGSTYGLRTGIYGIGGIIAPALTSFMADAAGGNWTGACVFMAAGCILGGIVFCLTPAPPQQLREHWRPPRRQATSA